MVAQHNRYHNHYHMTSGGSSLVAGWTAAYTATDITVTGLFKKSNFKWCALGDLLQIGLRGTCCKHFVVPVKSV